MINTSSIGEQEKYNCDWIEKYSIVIFVNAALNAIGTSECQTIKKSWLAHFIVNNQEMLSWESYYQSWKKDKC